MFGFYFLLVFVGATIPAGIWGKAVADICASLLNNTAHGRSCYIIKAVCLAGFQFIIS